jgi:hypothetical protein
MRCPLLTQSRRCKIVSRCPELAPGGLIVTDGASSRVPAAPEGALGASPRSRQSLSTRPNAERIAPRLYQASNAVDFIDESATAKAAPEEDLGSQGEKVSVGVSVAATGCAAWYSVEARWRL